MSERKAAIAVCQVCPLRLACAEWSLSLPTTDHAVYGGMWSSERLRIRRERRQREAARLEARRREGRNSERRRRATYPGICGHPDAYGRCSSQYHDPSCSHCIEATAAYGGTPEASDRWRQALWRHAAVPATDSTGLAWRDQHGQPMTWAAHVEAASGQRSGRSPFVSDPSHGRELARAQRVIGVADTSADPGTPEAYAEDMPGATVATAARLAAGLGLVTSADHAAQRQAWRAQPIAGPRSGTAALAGAGTWTTASRPGSASSGSASRPGTPSSATSWTAATGARLVRPAERQPAVLHPGRVTRWHARTSAARTACGPSRS